MYEYRRRFRDWAERAYPAYSDQGDALDQANKDVDILMKDRCTVQEAMSRLMNGTVTIFDRDDLAFFIEEMRADGGYEPEEIEAHEEMLKTGNPLTDWGVVEDDQGTPFFIMYVL